VKLVRYQRGDVIAYGSLDKDEICRLDGSIETGFSVAEQRVNLKEVRILCPVEPSKAVCIGLNYRDHIEESHMQIPMEPVVFIKPSTAVIAPEEGIEYPRLSNRVDYEGELAIVIRKRAKNVTEADAPKYILGYTCANDVTARDLQAPDGQWSVAKGFDTFLPLGPCIQTEADPYCLDIQTILNGKVVQHSNTKYLLFKPYWLVSYLSSIYTLLPGDVILTGTTRGIGPMQPGDTVVVSIENIGELKNTVVRV
jgi:2-keto-4-pentenoate hydratase/2-oxohepta-3-ene-1,7-dioic acid hydratase in catechol pathway